jgi:phosphate transport system permease protein
MPTLWILIAVLALAAVGYVLGRRRAMAAAEGDARNLHSLPNYYGMNVALFTAVPALVLLGVWLVGLPIFAESRTSSLIPEAAYEGSGGLSLIMADVRRVANGLDMAVSQGTLTEAQAENIRVEFSNVRDRLGTVGVAIGTAIEPYVLSAAQSYRSIVNTGRVLMILTVVGIAVGGFAFAFMRTTRDFRARNVVEQAVMGLLILASSIAILTTVGIVLSMLFEAIDFFSRYPASEFFFGTNWSPNFRGNSDLGIVPLLWGTLYISFIALLVAVPIGLLSAIYLSEYAGPRVRTVAKPAIEILAGIPTIVYGLFALITVGPFLRDYFAQPLGLGNSSSSVMTAGLVMGIMLIPFVSSLSDDVINAVPQSLRDGSLGLGATHSETIRQVVLPAALPGIVGSCLLAASRAIGETMIVVLGAGAAARLDLNPFEAMTTVTVKIVSQLTGDTDFNSPETLVAFALGLTLFVMTLCLNVVALVIVRRYREQYE